MDSTSTTNLGKQFVDLNSVTVLFHLQMSGLIFMNSTVFQFK